MNNTKIATGHLDKEGRMICMYDSVHVGGGPGGPWATVLWYEGQWILRYDESRWEPLNKFGQACLLKVEQ